MERHTSLCLSISLSLYPSVSLSLYPSVPPSFVLKSILISHTVRL